MFSLSPSPLPPLPSLPLPCSFPSGSLYHLSHGVCVCVYVCVCVCVSLCGRGGQYGKLAAMLHRVGMEVEMCEFVEHHIPPAGTVVKYGDQFGIMTNISSGTSVHSFML